LVATALLAVMTLTLEIASHHAVNSLAGKGSARQPAFDALQGDFWRILDRGRGGWKKPLAQAFR
jgi:hypothetical protein